MKTLLIDNYDSFTYNLYQLIAVVNRVPPMVVHNDACCWEDLQAQGFDNIVISPGPGSPHNKQDFGICGQVLAKADIPVLGVCLGHQGLCLQAGGSVIYAHTVMHGRTSAIHHLRRDLFEGIPSPFEAVRYHSLVVSDVPECLEVTAFTSSGTIMAVRHRERPQWGVQFHPESICSEYGERLLRNFRDITVGYGKSRRRQISRKNTVAVCTAEQAAIPVPSERANVTKPRLYHRQLPYLVAPERVFEQLFAHESSACFWLDSSQLSADARFSYMGDNNGPLADWISYNQLQQTLRLSRSETTLQQPLFEFLREYLQCWQMEAAELPFDFNLGCVGYFGYEMKGDCAFANRHISDYPDAQWLLVDRLLVFDHVEETLHLVCMDFDDQRARAHAWLDTIELKLRSCQPDRPKPYPKSATVTSALIDQFHRRLPAAAYLDAIAHAKTAIRRGETYEVCLTNTLQKASKADPLAVYMTLRANNPAPYAAYLKFGDLHVLCSSPERFLTVNRQGMVETKPIKGTRRRGATPLADEAVISDLRNSEKDRSENLMIVDLLRNDLGQVAETGSVEVKKLFDVESYSTVHQLVSTVQARLKRDSDVIDCIQACFPGGSMTGAPKKRTLEILGQLEQGARGIYSGAIGFLAFNGCADLNIVIRTLVMQHERAEIGVGGAIVDLSSPELELEETLLKSEALIAALAAVEGSSDC